MSGPATPRERPRGPAAGPRMTIAPGLRDELVAHALEEAPNECCGMIAAAGGRAVKVFRARNADASPLRYTLHPLDQLRIDREIEETPGWELGAIYHSHTRSEPVPSQTDVNRALVPESGRPWFPGVLYVIVGVAGPEPDVRAWDIASRRRQEAVELEIG